MGYGIPGIRADGNDVIATYQVTREAVEHARAGGGVTLVELVTYRRKGHAEHDDQRYVPPGEIEEWEKHDPIDRYTDRLTEAGWANEFEIAAANARVEAELDAAVARCVDEPSPAASTALGGVYVAPPAAPVEWYRTLSAGPPDRPSAGTVDV